MFKAITSICEPGAQVFFDALLMSNMLNIRNELLVAVHELSQRGMTNAAKW